MRKYKILVVDDSPLILKALNRALLANNWDIISAGSGDEALSIVEREDIDLIIADENMPGITGTELLKYITDVFPDTIRIMLTGADNIDFAQNAIKMGVIYRFFRKPWDDQELIMTIKEGLEFKRVK